MTKEKSKYLNIVHQNIQGFSGKDLEVCLFLNAKNIRILCITEHWLRDYELVMNLDNYTVASSFCRKSAIRGGSLIILQNDLKYKERSDIVSLSVERNIELSCVELDEMIIICVYRPPSGNYTQFESAMEDAFNIVYLQPNPVLLVKSLRRHGPLKKNDMPLQMAQAVEAVRKGECSMGTKTYFSTVEEAILEKWILEMAEKHIPVTRDELLDSVQRFIIDQNKTTPFTTNRPGKPAKTYSIGDYVIIQYEGDFFPGVIKIFDKNKFEISTMAFSVGNMFKWSEKEDKIWYQKSDIVKVISKPMLCNKRGLLYDTRNERISAFHNVRY
ncbi:hypothetical protein evm_004111 [Chilo suppressalis]|nr:hypothetical protein evm_004111 [Chilo suppressalis]